MHATSRGLDPRRLVAGSDLVLDPDPAHGIDLPDGVLAHDGLDPEVCLQIHDASLATLARCRELVDEALTVDGLCLSWLWELEIEWALATLVYRAEALRRAVERFDVDVLTLAGDDRRSRLLAAAVAAATGLDVVERRDAPPADRPSPPRGSRVRGARQHAVTVVRELGLPSRLRPGSTVFVSYWPLMPLLDRMLADRRLRPAVLLQRPPSGPSRSLRAARRGGWVGAPG
ncbi:MAG: hypothetical protein Q8O56_05375, partial [Solirubrobacteraceae bacterium]|nr:hypothetical protein [Solirubrobacteraceae bacterium]